MTYQYWSSILQLYNMSVLFIFTFNIGTYLSKFSLALLFNIITY